MSNIHHTYEKLREEKVLHVSMQRGENLIRPIYLGTSPNVLPAGIGAVRINRESTTAA